MGEFLANTSTEKIGRGRCCTSVSAHKVKQILYSHFPDEWRELGGRGGQIALEHFYIVDSYVSLSFSVSMEQSPSWEANMSLASQEIPHILWNLKHLLLHSQVHPPVPILRS